MDTFSFYIERGVKHGHQMKYPNMGNEFHDQATSDIIFIIVETPHPVFTRKGDNLHTVLEITLKEALLGFKKFIKHLDGHRVEVNRETVTQPGDIEKFVGEGMPQHEYSSFRGDLFVEYKVLLPKQSTPEQEQLWEEFFVNK